MKREFIIFTEPSASDPAYVSPVIEVTDPFNPKLCTDFEELKALISRIEDREFFKCAPKDKHGKKHPISPVRDK